MRQLYIGNKHCSSWSMRAGVLMRQAGIGFEEVMLRFDGFSPASRIEQRVAEVSPAGQVPVLFGDFSIADALQEQEFLDFEEPYRLRP
jgi:glutathione S-transferase